MQATLAVCIVEAPKWYRPSELYDTSLLEELYGQVVLHWNTFLRPRTDQAGGEKPASLGAGVASEVA